MIPSLTYIGFTAAGFINPVAGPQLNTNNIIVTSWVFNMKRFH